MHRNSTNNASLATWLMVFSAFVIVGCKTVSPQRTHWDNYKQAMDDSAGKADYVKARKSLEDMIDDPGTDAKMRKNAIELLSGKLFTGDFGNFDEESFIYWAKALGSNTPSWLKLRLKSVEMVNSEYQKNPAEVASLYTSIRKYCDDKTLVTEQLASSPDNIALRYLAAVECLSEQLVNKEEARKLYARHLASFGPRDNAQVMAKGFSLYTNDASEYEKLGELDKNALLLAKVQTLKYVANAKELKFKMKPTTQNYNQSSMIFNKLESDNDKDWQDAISATEQYIESNDIDKESKGFFYNIIMTSAFLKDRYEVYQEYAGKLLDNSDLGVQQKLFVELNRGLLLSEVGRSEEGLKYIDKAINLYHEQKASIK
ncbi:hypothetical protein [Aliikangiella coralliicola]|uniref:Tetratricopeptide repeat protein n=1 Tax=Aliikangiella coralliicola TaxID=2592383 RepID=A0A545UCC7_9GAMM|nr:hypothetical protein [Aliikangiella coralliicola]TQV87119.1 hypothetical protein FLL46_15045 [Aliikangiella coralliicola]